MFFQVFDFLGFFSAFFTVPNNKRKGKKQTNQTKNSDENILMEAVKLPCYQREI